jgi:hypothetical protein
MENNSDVTHLTIWVFVSFFVGYKGRRNLLDSLSDVLPTDAMIPFYAGLSYKREEPTLHYSFSNDRLFWPYQPMLPIFITIWEGRILPNECSQKRLRPLKRARNCRKTTCFV